MGVWIENTDAPCKGKSVNYQCFCPYRAHCFWWLFTSGRCPGLCASAPSVRAALTFDTPSTGNHSFPTNNSTLKKWTTFALQNESFCSLKGVLLPFKTSPFALQKESFCFPVILRHAVEDVTDELYAFIFSELAVRLLLCCSLRQERGWQPILWRKQQNVGIVLPSMTFFL